MREYLKFYIDGQWVDPEFPRPLDVLNPATETVAGRISLGSEADVDRAVAAARRAFDSFSLSSREQRMELLEACIGAYRARYNDIADAIREEMGAPTRLATRAQAHTGLGHLEEALRVLREFPFEEAQGEHRIVREPIGVCALITPWNWPVNQIACKVAPALAVGCTMVLKPSEIAPFSAVIWAEIMASAGVPPGVFNLVNGDGPTVGAALSRHEDVAMVSFTGSTRAGAQVAMNAAPTVKRVTQELGGKSPNIILDDADFERAVTAGARAMFLNTGQSCNAPSRMLVPRQRLAEAEEVARRAAEAVVIGDPTDEATTMGPLVSQVQYDRVQGLIARALEEGARLVAGGPGRPEGLARGYFVRPTIFSDVRNDMVIAREEVFGPVLVLIGYDTEDEAVEIANDTPYGLAGYVQGGDLERARRVAARIRAGSVTINGASGGYSIPFGGYKQSGNGREWGPHGFTDYLEIKAVQGYGAA